tara:strand:- start:653 stop:925 length:273 start_codon:yes stop_codon:yes gene_type:complete
MADRNELIQEKAGLVKQQQEIINTANAKAEELIKPIREETDAALNPLSARVAEINTQLLNDLDSEAGISHSVVEPATENTPEDHGEVCPA